MSRAPPSILLAPLPSPSTPLESISLLPCQIAHDGAAKIATYFPARPRTIKTTPILSQLTNLASKVVNITSSIFGLQTEERKVVKSPVPLEAAFRGRLLLSTPVVVPEGYTGLVFSTTTPAPTAVVTSVKSKSHEERPAKRVKVEIESSRNVTGTAKALMNLPDGRRRSPRKKPASKIIYSMDSDDEDEPAESGDDYPATPVDIEIVVKGVTVTEEIAEAVEMDLSNEPDSTQLAVNVSAPSSQQSTFFETTTTPLDSQKIEGDDLARDVQMLIPHSTFSSIQIWTADLALDPEEDLYAKGLLEWFAIADKVS